MDDKKGRRRESRFYKTQKRRMDRSDQYPDLAECKHGFVRRRIYSVILGRVALLARGPADSSCSRSHVTAWNVVARILGESKIVTR